MTTEFLKANNGDCILIKLVDKKGMPLNILIDGGMPKTYFDSSENKAGSLKKAIDKIKKSDQKIDLLILTHIDEDHIGGILTWLKKEKDAYSTIRKTWFNSPKVVASRLDLKSNEDLTTTIKIFSTGFTSVQQGIDFETYILKTGIWDQSLLLKGMKTVERGIEIKILSPELKNLKSLIELYKKKKKSYFTSRKGNDYSISIEKFIAEEDKDSYLQKEDDSPTNGSSIAFTLKYKRMTYLFLGDSHPGVIVQSLRDLGFTEKKRIAVEFVKLSHHGSSYNTTRELLSLIKTDNYIISTSGERHDHPHKRTVARIIKINPFAIIWFNYDNIRKVIFSKNDREKFQHVKLNVINEFPEC